MCSHLLPHVVSHRARDLSSICLPPPRWRASPGPRQWWYVQGWKLQFSIDAGTTAGVLGTARRGPPSRPPVWSPHALDADSARGSLLLHCPRPPPCGRLLHAWRCGRSTSKVPLVHRAGVPVALMETRRRHLRAPHSTYSTTGPPGAPAADRVCTSAHARCRPPGSDPPKRRSPAAAGSAGAGRRRGATAAGAPRATTAPGRLGSGGGLGTGGGLGGRRPAARGTAAGDGGDGGCGAGSGSTAATAAGAACGSRYHVRSRRQPILGGERDGYDRSVRPSANVRSPRSTWPVRTCARYRSSWYTSPRTAMGVMDTALVV